MNKRILELAEQAGYTKDMFGVGHWDMPECKKFAELIVKECCQVMESLPSSTYHVGRSRMSEEIKAHFGVEE